MQNNLLRPAPALDPIKSPPYSEEAERATLGAMMIDKDALEYGLENLKASDFYETRNAKIFAAMALMHSRGQSVDISSLSAFLRGESTLEAVGGAEYLTDLIASTTTAAHVETYVRFVKDKAMLRAVIRACTESIQSCYKQAEEPQEIVEYAEQQIYAIAQNHESRDMSYIRETVLDMQDKLEALSLNQNKIPGLKTGFQTLDHMTGGLQPGQLIIIAARPGAGKSAFALNIAEHVGVAQNLPVLYYSLEMGKMDLGMRLMTSMTGIDLYQLRTGYWGKEKWGKIKQVSEALYGAPIVLADHSNGLTAMSLRSSARRWFARFAREGVKGGLICVDYMQLMQSGGKRSENRNLEVAEISRTLKQTALDLKVPVIALSQLNRSTEQGGRDGRPQLSDLRDSGAIEQDADIVSFIYRPGMYKKGATDFERSETDFIIAKHRNGQLGTIKMRFHGSITKFTEVEQPDDFKLRAAGND